MGTLVFATQGWDPKWRAGEWLLFAGAIGGVTYWLSRTTPPPMETAILIAALWPVVQGGVAWLVGERLARPALFLLGDGRAKEAHELARPTIFALLIALAGGWALLSLVLPDVAVVEGSSAVMGGMVCVAAALAYLALLNQMRVHEELVDDGVHIDATFRPRPSSAVLRVLGILVLFAALLPANLSPLHLKNFNRWMEVFTERVVGPLLVPRHGSARWLGESARQLSVEGALEGLARTGSTNPVEDLLALSLRIGVFVLVVYVGWRIFRTSRNTVPGGGGMGSLIMGLKWLYQEVRQWVIQWLIRLGWLGPVKERVNAYDVAGSASSGRSARRGRPLLSSVVAVYCHVIDRLSHRGLSRHQSETPYEFLARWHQEVPGGDARGMPYLTDLYVAARYEEQRLGSDGLTRARRAASRTLRGWTRAALTARVLGWMKRDDPRGKGISSRR